MEWLQASPLKLGRMRRSQSRRPATEHARRLPNDVDSQERWHIDEGLEVTLTVGTGSADTVTRIAAGKAEMGTGDINPQKFRQGLDMLVKVAALSSRPRYEDLIDLSLLPMRADRTVF